ncbi:polysaccharide deacetylase family protein [Actinomadura parmotrematis]|uniref:polysaccharide deacetylase family protein n=1 Tax=Actinomadura parmotrematis TaxID=2864039 RepID=UPI0027E37FB4|nr:polysaccharide deacetylase family protein [Actinomadura parmotrematis]
MTAERAGQAQQAAVAKRRADTPTPTPTPSPPPPRDIDCAKVKCLALTFDDGPGEYTERLLKTLQDEGVRATFFMLGENVHHYRDLVRRMALDGQELANHSWSHPQLTGLTSSAVRSQVRRTQNAIKEAAGVTPALFRPPYGATDKRVGKAVGMPEIVWSVDTLDWRYRSVSRARRVGVKEPKRNGVVLFHDIHESTVDAMPAVVDGLKRRGFTLVTVSELYRGTPLKAGRLYPKW